MTERTEPTRIFWLSGHPPQPGEAFHVLGPDGQEILPAGGWESWREYIASILHPLGMSATDPDRLVQMYVNTRQCVLCKTRPGYWLGLFVPETPLLWPGPPLRPGKHRTFIYGLCRHCRRVWPKKTLAQRVETTILQRGWDGDSQRKCQ
jgi:hypothetical protein